eukprot:CAMPEP_0117591546 /NCGR_PEP_ID=MMETSP0784-20121206/71595_1 /TAXON_ID=39447 /ORGANISM="" /LENGTH=72 /DNA_ID=CAMNT_0005393285 /DNA_START=46 /DNA_END=261 /DNA_ORIENTATION=+
MWRAFAVELSSGEECSASACNTGSASTGCAFPRGPASAAVVQVLMDDGAVLVSCPCPSEPPSASGGELNPLI